MTPLRKAAFALAAAIVIAATVHSILSYHRQYPHLPYQDSFASEKVDEWTSYGGSWRVKGDEMINRSDEPGAKLITGSPLWTDYQINVDLMLRSRGGDVGVILRASDAEVGNDAFRGYYVGIRSNDSAIVSYRTDHDGLGARPINVLGGVQVGAWYHLRVVVVGCEIGAAATNLSSGISTYAAMRDSPGDCIANGKVGIRSTASGAWRRLHVSAAGAWDLHEIERKADSIELPLYPIREDDYSKMHDRYFSANSFPRVEVPLDALVRGTAVPLVTVESLRSGANFDSEVRLRGVVTFAEPAYLQDATGGVMLQTDNSEAVNIGDEVQVIGRPVSGGFSPVFSVSSVQLLREKPPIMPLSVTATEAASGAEAGSFVEVTGVVKRRIRSNDGAIVLEMADPAQNFSVSLTNSPFNNLARNWSVGSTLRVSGICTVSPEATSGDSFTILVGSPSEISVISGPPWWSGWRLVRTIALSLLTIVIGVYVFFRLERSKHRAILQERERLAHTMHDTLAQSFAGVGYYLQSIRRSLRKSVHLPNEVLEELDIACALVTDTHRQASASIAALHPDTLAHQDLLKALVRSATTMLGGAPLPIALQREGHTRALPPAVVEALYQVGCEAISNVLRHAHANSLKLGVHYGSKYVTLSIEDDGVGFTQDAANDGFGVQGMRHRCQAIGAQLTIRTDPGRGCTVSIAAPYRCLGSISGLLRTHLWRQWL